MTSNAFKITEEKLPDAPELARRVEALAEQAERQDGMLSLIHISEPTRLYPKSRMPSCA